MKLCIRKVVYNLTRKLLFVFFAVDLFWFHLASSVDDTLIQFQYVIAFYIFQVHL